MMSYKEMAANVLEARDRYEEKKKRRKTLMLRCIPAAAGLCLAVVLGAAATKHPLTDIPQPPDIVTETAPVTDEEPVTAVTEAVTTASAAKPGRTTATAVSQTVTKPEVTVTAASDVTTMQGSEPSHTTAAANSIVTEAAVPQTLPIATVPEKQEQTAAVTARTEKVSQSTQAPATVTMPVSPLVTMPSPVETAPADPTENVTPTLKEGGSDDPYGIKAVCRKYGFIDIAPANIPEGFELIDIGYEEQEDVNVLFINFNRKRSRPYGGIGETIYLIYSFNKKAEPPDNWDTIIPPPDVENMTSTVNGYEFRHYYSSLDKQLYAIYTDNNQRFTIMVCGSDRQTAESIFTSIA